MAWYPLSTDNQHTPAKPPPGSQLNRAHPLAQGLVGCWVLNEAGGVRYHDAGTGRFGTLTSVSWSGGGLLFLRSTSSNGLATVADTTQYTLFSIQKHDGHSSNRSILDQDLSSFRCFQHRVTNTQYAQTIAFNLSNAAFTATSANTVPTGIMYSQAASVSASSVGLYINGILSGSAAITGTLRGISSTRNLCIGVGYAGTSNPTSQPFGGEISVAYVYNRALSASEIASLHANPYQMFMQSPMWVNLGTGGTTYTETLYDTAVTVATITDLTTRVESLLTTLSALGSATETATASESVSTTAQATGTVQAAVTAVESLLSTLVGTGSVTDSVSGVAAETVITVASGSSAVTDVLNLVESALVMVQSADSVSGVVATVEALVTSMQAVASSQDDVFSGLVENVLTTAVGTASAEAVQAMQETVLVMAQAGASLATVAAFIEQVSSTATATGSVVDAIVGSFLGSYLCGTEVRQRPYVTEVRQRPYVTEVRQRPNTMEVRQRCR